MSGCGCNIITPGAFPPPTAALCPSTSTQAVLPCQAPSYSRACLKGDPTKSPLFIERAARAEHLWQRTYSIQIAVATTLSGADILYAAFTSSGDACLKSVSAVVTGAGGGLDGALPVGIVGIAGVWDFTDSGPNWTTRVAIPCEVEAGDIITTSGRCPCDIDCEGCLYPAGVGGLFMVRYRFPTTTLPIGARVTFTATGNHTPTEPCCLMPVYLAEPAVVITGTIPTLQGFLT